ncbi:GNAT family N-acetyltransferase [Asticcacaulis solisilvae]|uniref:GNAT family N-acetyltransferase n=1 Tax=Asticcacaulis solisilvae TaxID=1217274 RepID=UPI003FD70A8A
MKIRFADSDDIPQLLQLYRHLDPDDRITSIEDGRRNWDVLTRYPGSNIIVGHVDDAMVATCTLIVIPNLTRGGMPYALIENVVTDAGHRNKGHGKAVLKHAAEAAWAAGCYKVMLMTGSKRPETLNFYLGAGFEQSKTGFQMRRLPIRQD